MKKYVTMRDFARHDYEQFQRAESFTESFLTGLIALITFAVVVLDLYLFAGLFS